MKLQSSESIILKQIDFKENDKIITFLTKDQGKKSGILRGAKKLKSRHVGASEPFVHATIFYVEKANVELVTIRKFDLLESFYSIRQSYNKIVYAAYCTELVHLCVIDPEAAYQFFDLLLLAYHMLQDTPSLEQTKIQFEVHLFRLLGIFPNLESCICGKPLWKRRSSALPQLNCSQAHQLDCAEGGIRCPDCFLEKANAIDLSPGTLSYLRYLEQHKSEPDTIKVQATVQNTIELDNAFLTHFRYHVGKDPKSHTFLTRQNTMTH